MNEETPTKETPSATTELSEDDLEKVAGGCLPEPLPRPIAPPEGVLPVGDIPLPIPDTLERRFIRR